MNHERASMLLHDFVDGDLSASNRGALEGHLAACEECRAEVAYYRSLQRRAADLRQPIAPPYDLWPGIAAAIAPDAQSAGATGVPTRVRRPSRWRLLGLPFEPAHVAAAATAAGILLGAAALWHGGNDLARRMPAAVTSAVTRPATAPAVPGMTGAGATAEALAAVTRPDPRERIAFATLSGPPATGPAGEAFRLGLAQLDAAIAELETAWLADPSNANLAYRLATAYQDRALLQTRADRLDVQL